MCKKSEKGNKPPKSKPSKPKLPVSKKMAFSIKEFARTHSISRTHLYTLFKVGMGPDLMRVGGRRLVSVEAAKKWRTRMETYQTSPANENLKGADCSQSYEETENEE